jgi:aminopeptidase-like protein
LERAVLFPCSDLWCGYDERQYCSPGFDLPVGCFMRMPWGRYPEYHASADNLYFVRAESLADSFERVLVALSVVENDETYVNLNPYCEPQLGRRGLYRAAGGRKDERLRELALLWVLNLSDSRHSLLDIAERSGLEFGAVKAAADSLLESDLFGKAIG